jgi:hypothetical protein
LSPFFFDYFSWPSPRFVSLFSSRASLRLLLVIVVRKEAVAPSRILFFTRAGRCQCPVKETMFFTLHREFVSFASFLLLTDLGHAHICFLSDVLISRSLIVLFIHHSWLLYTCSYTTQLYTYPVTINKKTNEGSQKKRSPHQNKRRKKSYYHQCEHVVIPRLTVDNVLLPIYLVNMNCYVAVYRHPTFPG